MGDVLLALYGFTGFLDLFHYGINGFGDPLLQEHGIGAGSHILQSFSDHGLGQ